MPDLSPSEWIFVGVSFFFQGMLALHFALRKWRFDTAVRWGWIIYLLSLPAAALSLVFLLNGREWWLWAGGLLYLVWAMFGLVVEYGLKIDWRTNGPKWILGVYVLLYLATVMFYWWPLARIWKPLWIAAGVLFVLNSILNITSHRKPGMNQQS